MNQRYLVKPIKNIGLNKNVPMTGFRPPSGIKNKILILN